MRCAIRAVFFVFVAAGLQCAAPLTASADIIFDPSLSLVAEHAGVQIPDLWPNDQEPVMRGDELSGITGDWTLHFVQPSGATPANRAIYILTRLNDFDLYTPQEYSYVHAPIPNDGDDSTTDSQTVSFNSPSFGDPETPSGHYQIRIYRLPETKYACEYDNEGNATCADEPYTDDDFWEFFYYSVQGGVPPEGEESPITYEATEARRVGFEYVAGQAAQPQQAAPSVANLRQFRQFGVDEVAEGASFIGNAAVFKAEVADADSEQVRLEIEVKPWDVPFDEASTTLSELSDPGELSVALDELIPVKDHYEAGKNVQTFHWRARAIDAEGNASPWQQFSSNILSTDNFTAKVVPLYTQISSEYPGDSEEWSGRLYASGIDDDCSKSDPTNATIAKCGCAMTSLVMIARYYGLSSGIDGKAINPLNLNAWLQANGGYTSKNTVNWSKAEEYLGTKISGSPYAVLALDRANFKTSSTNVVDSYLSQEEPVIAFKSSAGHYIVMDSKVSRPEAGATYTVRDPRWYNTKTLADSQNLAGEVRGYGNSFTHVTIFTKLETPRKIAAHTEFYLASPAELLVTDPQGNKAGKDPVTGVNYSDIPGALYYLEDPIISSEEDIDPATVHQIKVLELPALADGEYSVQVIGTGSGSYTLTSAMTDDTGSTTIESFVATTTPGQVTKYELEVAGGEPQDTSPAPDAPTLSELTVQLKSAISSAKAKPLVKLLLQVQVAAFELAIKKNKLKEAKTIIGALQTEVALLEKKKELPAVDADTILGILASMRGLL